MNRISRVLPTVTYQPVLKGIKFKVEEELITMIASDGILSIMEIVDDSNMLDIISTGDFIVEGKVLITILQKMDLGWMHLQLVNNTIILKNGKMTAKLNRIVEREYPNIPFELAEHKIEMNASLIKKSLESVLFAASDRESRPVLEGINFKIKNNELTLTATDSYRVAIYHTSILNVVDNEVTFTVAKKIFSLFNIIFNKEDIICITYDEKKVVLKTGNIILRSNLLEGQYPQINNLITNVFQQQILVDPFLLLNAIDRCYFLKTDGVSIVHISIHRESLSVSAVDKEIGSFLEVIPISNLSSNNFDFYVNGRYMIEALGTLLGDKVLIKYNSNLKPFILENPSIKNNLQILLPIKC